MTFRVLHRRPDRHACKNREGKVPSAISRQYRNRRIKVPKNASIPNRESAP